jgi:hypothetical protein
MVVSKEFCTKGWVLVFDICLSLMLFASFWSRLITAIVGAELTSYRVDNKGRNVGIVNFESKLDLMLVLKSCVSRNLWRMYSLNTAAGLPATCLEGM